MVITKGTVSEGEEEEEKTVFQREVISSGVHEYLGKTLDNSVSLYNSLRVSLL